VVNLRKREDSAQPRKELPFFSNDRLNNLNSVYNQITGLLSFDINIINGNKSYGQKVLTNMLMQLNR